MFLHRVIQELRLKRTLSPPTVTFIVILALISDQEAKKEETEGHSQRLPELTRTTVSLSITL